MNQYVSDACVFVARTQNDSMTEKLELLLRIFLTSAKLFRLGGARAVLCRTLLPTTKQQFSLTCIFKKAQWNVLIREKIELLVHLVVTLIKLPPPGGVKRLISENQALSPTTTRSWARLEIR